MILNTLFPKAERRTTGGSLARPQQWLTELTGGNSSSAGISIDEDRAMMYSAVYCAVILYMKAIKMLPWGVYRSREDGGRDIAREHPVHGVLSRRPNAEMTPARFKSYMMACLKLWGNAYAEIEQARNGRVIALWPIHPSRVTPKRADDESIIYSINNYRHGLYEIPSYKMYHVMGYSKDGVSGMSVISLARECIGTSLAIEKYGGQFFGNGAAPGGIVKRPSTAPEWDNDEARNNFMNSFKGLHGGDKRHSVALLEDDMDYVPVNMPHDDMQFLETRQFQVLDIARWFDVPPHKLKHLADATFSNIEHQQMEWYTDSVSPETVEWEEEADNKLFTAAEQLEYYTKFNMRAQLRGDHVSRSNYYRNLVNMGAYSINEVRDFEDMNPIGDIGDKRFIQTNMTTLDAIASGANTKNNNQNQNRNRNNQAEQIKTSMMPIFVDTLTRFSRKEQKAREHAEGKYKDDAEAMNQWSEKFYVPYSEQMIEGLQAPSYSLAKMLSIKTLDVVDLIVTNCVNKWCNSPPSLVMDSPERAAVEITDKITELMQ